MVERQRVGSRQPSRLDFRWRRGRRVQLQMAFILEPRMHPLAKRDEKREPLPASHASRTDGSQSRGEAREPWRLATRSPDSSRTRASRDRTAHQVADSATRLPIYAALTFSRNSNRRPQLIFGSLLLLLRRESSREEENARLTREVDILRRRRRRRHTTSTRTDARRGFEGELLSDVRATGTERLFPQRRHLFAPALEPRLSLHHFSFSGIATRAMHATQPRVRSSRETSAKNRLRLPLLIMSTRRGARDARHKARGRRMHPTSHPHLLPLSLSRFSPLILSLRRRRTSLRQQPPPSLRSLHL